MRTPTEYVGILSAAGRRVPAWGWLVGVGLLAVAFLAWHQFARDDADTDWTDPKEAQPPLVAAFCPGQHGTGAPATMSAPIRGRSYADALVHVDGSIMGGVN